MKLSNTIVKSPTCAFLKFVESKTKKFSIKVDKNNVLPDFFFSRIFVTMDFYLEKNDRWGVYEQMSTFWFCFWRFELEFRKSWRYFMNWNNLSYFGCLTFIHYYIILIILKKNFRILTQNFLNSQWVKIKSSLGFCTWEPCSGPCSIRLWNSIVGSFQNFDFPIKRYLSL